MTTKDLITGPTIALYSGNYFDFEDPFRTPPTIEDIAHGLSMTCRYGGQCPSFYSVAEHSVLASYIVEPRFAYDALMHDAAEAFTGDMVKPLKEMLPDFKEVEDRVERAISFFFGVSNPLPQKVKTADVQMLVLEKDQLMHNTDDWVWTAGIEKPHIALQFWTPFEAKRQFLARFNELREPESAVRGFGQ